MTVYLHIGMQKTGSSSLESTFADNRALLLSSGIDYPDFGRQAHHELPWAIQGRRVADPPAQLAQIRIALEHSRAAKIVLSSEDLCGLKAHHLVTLSGILPAERPVRVVCYFRHPVDWVEAQLNQKVKSSDLQAVRSVVPTYIGRTDYFAMIEKWAAVFGPEAIRARVYRSGTDVIADFLRVIEANPRLALQRSAHPINVSLSEPLIRIKQIANRYGHSRALRAALNDIQIATNMGPRAKFLSPADLLDIEAAASEPMRQLWAKYIDKGEAPFDLAPAVHAKAPATREESLRALEVLVGIFAAHGSGTRLPDAASDDDEVSS